MPMRPRHIRLKRKPILPPHHLIIKRRNSKNKNPSQQNLSLIPLKTGDLRRNVVKSLTLRDESVVPRCPRELATAADVLVDSNGVVGCVVDEGRGAEEIYPVLRFGLAVFVEESREEGLCHW